MLLTKKAKIRAYIAEKQSTKSLTPFDSLLQEYLYGGMKNRLAQIGAKYMEIHVDWLPEYRCMNIQCRYRDVFLDIQIEPGSYSIAWDRDEADDPQEFLLESVVKFYEQIEETVESIP